MSLEISERDVLIEGEDILSSLVEGNKRIIATNKRLIRYITTDEGIGIMDLSYDTISSINVFFKPFRKRYFWLSGIGVLLIVISLIAKDLLKTSSIEQQTSVLLLIGFFLLILGIVLKSEKSYAGLELLGVAIPKTKVDKNEINPWNFKFENKSIEELLEFAKVVRSMVNYYRSLRMVQKVEANQ